MSSAHLTALIVSACLTTSCGVPTTARVDTPIAVRPLDDRQVLRPMVHHHREAVEMAAQCIEKVERAEMRAFCKHMSDDHQASAGQLEGWWAQWFPQNKMESSSGHGSEQFRALADRMRAERGSKFEETFLRAIRVHHRQGRDSSQACMTSATHPELKTFCAKELEEQKQEVLQTDRWICEWFRDCSGGATR